MKVVSYRSAALALVLLVGGVCNAQARCPTSAPSDGSTLRRASDRTYKVLASGTLTLPTGSFVPDAMGPRSGAFGGGDIAHVDGRWWQVEDRAAYAGTHVRAGQPERVTLVWQRAEERWTLSHVHLSRSVPLGSRLETVADVRSTPAIGSAVARRTRTFWEAWTAQQFDDVADHYVEHDDTLVFLPWVPKPFLSWDSFFGSARGIIEASERSRFVPKGTSTVDEGSAAATTSGIWTADILGADGKATTGDARYTLFWLLCDGEWKIAHEHLSSIVKP